MNNIKKALLFAAINIMGFSSAAFLFWLGYMTGVFNYDSNTAEQIAQQQHMFHGTVITWLVCAIFSISYFFLERRQGLIFLWAALVIPLLYGLNVLY